MPTFDKLWKKGVFFILPLFVLTACTGREDVMMELDAQTENAAQTAAVSEAEDAVHTESAFPADERTGADAASTESDLAGMGAASATGNPTGAEMSAERTEEIAAVIYVHICGAVEAPGVYELSAGSRVYEGIAAAGGFREDACEEYVNQAMSLQDGQRLLIPTIEEVETAREEGSLPDLWKSAGMADASGATAVSQAAGTVSAAQAAAAAGGSSGQNGLVNINTASESELCGIDGIGAGKAAAIVRYRQENGNFATIEEIMQVGGIKEGTYEKIKDKITVN